MRKSFKAFAEEAQGSSVVDRLTNEQTSNITHQIADELDKAAEEKKPVAKSSKKETGHKAVQKAKEEVEERKYAMIKRTIDDGERTRVGVIITERAKANLEKYMAEYGYRKISPFINDLLEHLDAYL